ncbi:LysR family transcriptional regulator [Bosea sp. ASV33]|uniref:LysR family transcriptional regulator n=1 Tax=Bosea sp. ASV33 TaxID=2795106 RepID=UPI0018ECB544|nr:LysR family transcriptional regulator [Bosea sp. ASV33]
MSLPSLDPDLLRSFVAVADNLSFTRAAHRLNRTQAAVSAQIRRLEQRLDTRLFVRSTVHVQLSEQGNMLLADARRMLSLHDAAVARLAGRSAEIHLRLALMEDYGTKHLPHILAEMSEEFPTARIDVEVGLTSRLLKHLGRSFDAVIAMHAAGSSDGMLICREKAIWVAAADRHVEYVDPLPVALSNPDCLFRNWASSLLDEARRPWRLAYVSPSFTAVEAIVERGLAVSVMKASLVSARLRQVSSTCLPALPDAEIRLHLAAGLDREVLVLTNQIARRLGEMAQ